jgi:hypothetical protein
MASRTPSRHDPNRTSPCHIREKERLLKNVRDQNEITYKSKSIKITVEFSTEALKARKVWIKGNNNKKIIIGQSLTNL